MPKAKKLQSGSWRCQVMKNGIRKSFTVDDPSKNGKRLCEMMAAEWANENNVSTNGNITIGEAVKRYIDTRKGVLSVSTIRSYEGIAKNITKISGMPVNNIDEEDLQRWMSDLALTHSAKSCANIRSLVTASIRMFVNGFSISIGIPQRTPIDYHTPTDTEVRKLLEHSKGTEMEKAIILAAFGTLRRGEICALTRSDISGNAVHISKSVAQIRGGEYVIKGTKNEQSTRTVQLPKKVIKVLLAPTDSERIVNMTPSAISNRFEHLLKECGLPKFRFHDLRAYAASSRHAMGIPDVYVMADGGWKTDNVMKRVYRRAMEDKRAEFSKKAAKHYEGLL